MKRDQTTIDLLKAAQIMRERGWCRGKYMGPDKRVCLMGAINLAVFGYAVFNATFGGCDSLINGPAEPGQLERITAGELGRIAAAHRRLGRFISGGGRFSHVSIIDTNDDPTMTEAKAVEYLQGAAEMVEP